MGDFLEQPWIFVGDLPIFRTGAKCDGWNQGAIWPYFIILENKKSFDDDGRWWTNMWFWVGISSGDGLSATNFGLTVFSKGKIGIWIGESCEKSPDFFVRGRASICANHDPAINEILGLGKGWHLGRWDLYRWGKPFLVVVCFPRPLHKPSWFLVMGLNMFEPFWWIFQGNHEILINIGETSIDPYEYVNMKYSLVKSHPFCRDRPLQVSWSWNVRGTTWASKRPKR